MMFFRYPPRIERLSMIFKDFKKEGSNPMFMKERMISMKAFEWKKEWDSKWVNEWKKESLNKWKDSW